MIILFITPTTEYVVAETTLWHQKPAQDIPTPVKSEAQQMAGISTHYCVNTRQGKRAHGRIFLLDEFSVMYEG